MNRENIYKKSCDILYKAYFDGTLQHENCSACACGNLIAGNKNYTFKKRGNENYFDWNESENSNHWYNKILGYKYYNEEGEDQINATGYTEQEFRQIEKAFEGINSIYKEEDRMFKGLVAVLEELAKIHEIEETTNTKEKERFKKHYLELIEN